MTEERIQRRLSAIVAADVVGYSRLIETNEGETIARQKALRNELIAPLIADHQGRIVKMTGDGLLVEFGSAVDATECAVSIQRAIREREANVGEDRRISYRIGINLGDVVIDDDDILGDGVNVAARLESLAMPGSVFISGHVYEQIAGKIGVDFTDLGDRPVKNISRLIHVWGWSPQGANSLEKFVGSTPSKAMKGEPSISVLPFENRGSDTNDLYLADGISEEVTTELSGYGWLKVIARSTSFTYRDVADKTSALERELGVR
jgi:adenylate cyclase